MEDRRPTAADVAVEAGVSRSTVSYILNGTNRQTFAPETVEKVRAAAARLSYTPQAAARALRRGQSGVVLLALPDVPASANFSKLLSVLTDAVRATGRSLVTLAIRPGNGLIDMLRDLSPVALLEVLPLAHPDRTAARAARIPIVSVAEAIQGLDFEAAALQVRHLGSLGHQRLGVVTVGEPGTGPFAGARLDAVLRAAEALGLPEPTRVSISGSTDVAVDRLVEALTSWCHGPAGVTGLCCFNDLVAGVAVAAARRLGLAIPAQLSVVGIDDEPLGGLLAPALTTVRYDYRGIGDQLRAQLEHLLDGGPEPTAALRDTIELLVRDSTGPSSS